MTSEVEREAWMHTRWEIAFDPNASAPVAINPEPPRELPPLIYYRADHLTTCPNIPTPAECPDPFNVAPRTAPQRPDGLTRKGGPDDPRHGITLTLYSHYGCRCGPCSALQRAANTKRKDQSGDAA